MAEGSHRAEGATSAQREGGGGGEGLLPQVDFLKWGEVLNYGQACVAFLCDFIYCYNVL